MIDIEVSYSENRYLLFVSGHADYAPKGRDIVCAAVSVLAETLRCGVEEMNCAGELERCFCTADDGQATVDFTARESANEKAGFFFKTIVEALSNLAFVYPGHITVN